MALYPTPSGQRIPYDRDGSAAATSTGVFTGALTDLTTGQVQALNNESSLSGAAAEAFYVVFSHLWDLTEYFVQTDTGDHAGTLQYSTNTTTGQDGAWTDISTSFFDNWNNPVAPAYRSDLTAVSIAGVQGLRWAKPSLGHNFTGFVAHFYGNPTSGANPDSLRIWQAAAGEWTTPVDNGDDPRGTTVTDQIRVHNQSATKTAYGITVSGEALTDASPSLLSQMEFSTDNINFFSSISIGNLAPGATSAVLYVRDQIASGAQLGVWAPRIVAVPVSFA